MFFKHDKGLWGYPQPPLEKSIIAVSRIQWWGPGTTLEDLESPKGLLELSKQVLLFDLTVKHLDKIGFHFTDFDIGQFLLSISDKEVKTQKMNEIVYNQVMGCLRRGQIPIILGGDNSLTFPAIEAVSKKVPSIDVLQIGSNTNMVPDFESKWAKENSMFNVTSRISNVTNVVQIGAKNFSKEEIQYIQTLNSAHEKTNSISGMLSGIGKTNTQVFPYFEETLSREMLEGVTWAQITELVSSHLGEWTWVSIDMNILCSTLQPNVPYNIFYLIEKLVKNNKKILGIDIVGLKTNNQEVGLRLLHRLGGLAAVSQNILTLNSMDKK